MLVRPFKSIYFKLLGKYLLSIFGKNDADWLGEFKNSLTGCGSGLAIASRDSLVSSSGFMLLADADERLMKFEFSICLVITRTRLVSSAEFTFSSLGNLIGSL
jgi:hypothetical protein